MWAAISGSNFKEKKKPETQVLESISRIIFNAGLN